LRANCHLETLAIAQLNLGVLALATHPKKTVKKNLGETGVPVHFADIDFHPGDWLYADADGMIVSPTALQR